MRLRIYTGAAIALTLLSAGCGKKEEKEVEAPSPVQVAPVEQATIHKIVEADAVLWAHDQFSVMPKISAPVQKFLANRGDHVKAGQLIAVLENRDLRASASASKGQLDQAEANLRTTTGVTVPEAVVKAKTDVTSAQQQVDAARKLLESRRNLFQQGALARRLVDEAQVQYAAAEAALATAQEHLRAQQSVGNQETVRTAQAQVESARGQFQSAEAQVAYSEVRSPITGVIADRPLFPGDTASTGQPLFVVMDISRIVARANVPQAEAASVKVGQPAIIRLADRAFEVSGKVTVVSPATDPASTTVQVWVEAANPTEQLKPGASVRVAITVATLKDVTVVPAPAIVPGEEGGSAVVTVSGSNTAHQKKVEVGVREGDKVQILSGVSPGDQVIVVGAVGLEDKAKVRIVKPGEKDEDEKDKDQADDKKGGEKK
jgi:multidrug efflux pump subunit AcrA (membrane-fusion protein)